MMQGQALTVQIGGAAGSERWCEAAAAALAAAGWLMHDTQRHAPVPDACLWRAPDAAALAALMHSSTLAAQAHDSALVVHTGPGADAAAELALLQRGAEAVLAGDDAAATARALLHAVWRKRFERAARTAYATDLATGLPHQAQLLEHMAQLVALREREPAPMVLLVLQLDGLEEAAARLGSEAANVLRRKLAVRLRGALRASDVVAALTPDSFGVLLGRLESKGDGERVAHKLVQALASPVTVTGQSWRVQPRFGLALYPDHGKDAQTLLQRAAAQAGSVATQGADGFGARIVRLHGSGAANDTP
jgi:diguanylate cyclase (GGDEF)-like protein